MSNQTIDRPADAAILINPFPGLRPFEFDESHLFFGRDGQSERLITKLAATRFLAVVGTSGSGKSSLVRAGLLPALYSGFMPSAGSAWRIAVMRPGNDPLGNLARALNATDVFGSDDEADRALQIAITEVTLRRGSLGLVEAAREQQLPLTENLLVVADQFEELFRVEPGGQHAERENDRAAFVKLLLAAKAQREVNIYVVLTMRSDYLGDCAQFWELPEAINESQYLIPRLTREQIRAAITGPLFVGGAEATPRLINRLLNDVGDNPDQLPILQHALMRTWNHWEATGRGDEARGREGDGVSEGSGDAKRYSTRSGSDVVSPQNSRPPTTDHRPPIDLAHYEAIGGMERALSLHADEAFNELPVDRHRIVAERVFKALTEKGTDNREIRRPVTLGELCLVADASAAEIKQVIESFRAPGRSFLMPPAETKLAAESLIDISHESLMRNWLRLKDWVAAEAESAGTYCRLAETAGLFLKKKAGLWRDPDLQLALDWQSVARPNKHWAERYDKGYDAAITFLENSKAQRTADVAAAKGQQREKTKRTQRLKIALSELQTAKYASTVSLAGKYFDTNDLYEGHSLLNLALPGRDARMYRLRGFYWYHLWKRNHHEQVTLGEFDHFVTSISFNPNGALVGIGWDGIGRLWKKESLLSFSDTVPDQKNRLWTVKKGEMPDIVNRGDDELGKYVYMTSISPDGGKLAGGRLNGEITVWSVANWEELVTFPGEEDDEFLRELCFNSEGNRLASLRGSSKLAIWDLSTKERIPIDSKSIHKHYCLAFSQDGLVIASGANGIVNLWDAQNGKELLSLKVKNLSDVVSLAFSPNGRLLAGGIAGGTVKLWDIEDRKELGKLISDDSDDVTSLVFSPDGRMLAGAGFCTVFLWDINTRKQLMAFKGHIDRINSVAFSLDGKMLASGSSDRTIKLWKVPTEEVSGALSGGKTITVQALSKGRY